MVFGHRNKTRGASVMRSVSYLLLGFLIALIICIPAARSETIPSTVNTTNVTDSQLCYQFSTNGHVYGSCHSTAAGMAESDFITGWNLYSGCTDGNCLASFNACQPYSGSTYLCTFQRINGNGSTQYLAPISACPTNTTWNGSHCVQTSYSCPTGYTISADGQSCSIPDCPSGTTRNSGGDCVTPCPPDGDKSHNGQGYSYSVNITNYTGVCVNGCSYRTSGVDACIDLFCNGTVTTSKGTSCGATDVIPVSLYKPESTPQSQPQFEQNNPAAPGSSGQSSPSPATTEESCTASGMGYFTYAGVTTCVPNGTGAEKSVTRGTETTQNPDGTSNSKTIETTKNADGSVTEKETTFSKDAAGNVTGTEVKQVNNTLEGFCRNNPDAALCKKNESKSFGGGTCSEAPTCSGDAIQCAILTQQWLARCETNRLNDFTSAPGQPGSFASKTPEIDAKKVELSTLINTIKIQAAALFTFNSTGGATLGCDAPIIVLGQPFQFCWSKYDSQLTMVGAALVFVSLVISVFIILG